MRTIIAWSLAVALSVAACGATGSAAPSPPPSAPASSPAPSEAADGSTGTALAASREQDPRTVTLVALGDGYTRGSLTSVPGRDSWPAQLAEALRRSGFGVLLWNLAQQSHTSDLVVEVQLGQVKSLEPDVVTLQVGVNDIITRDTTWEQKKEWYRGNLETIFDELLGFLPSDRIFAITTPDQTLWGRSFAAIEDPRAAVQELNGTLAEVATARGIAVIDISAINALAAADPSLIIRDGPYGTPKQYAGWVEIIARHVYAAISAGDP